MKRILLILLLALGAASAGDEPRVWVHAPAEDLLGLFPDKGAGYMISSAEYETLRTRAAAREQADRDLPPLAGRIVRGTSTARVDGDVLRIEAHYMVVVQGDRPTEVPFRVKGIAVERVAVEGGELAGDHLRFNRPGTYSVTAELSARFGESQGLRRTEFVVPSAAAQTIRIALPPEVEGEVGPIVRAFKSGKEGGAVVGYPDGNGLFKIWMRARAEARKLDPILGAWVDTQAEVGEARTILSSRLSIEVLRAPVRRIELSLPTGQTIRALSGKGVKNWRVSAGEAGRDRLEISFVEPVNNGVQLQLQAEYARDDTDQVSLPILGVPDAVRFGGRLTVTARPEVRVTDITAEGVRRIEPGGKGSGGVRAAYEVWSRDARVNATVERIASRTRAYTRGLLALHEGGKILRLQFRYSILGKPLFRLEPQLPAGWILRSLKLDGSDAEHRYGEDGKLVMVFPDGLKPGNHVLDLRLDTDEVDWVPNEGAADFTFAGPRSGLDEESGYLVVASDPAFRVSVKESNGLQTVGMPVIEAAGFKRDARVLYAWRFDTPDYATRFELERHNPQISATVVENLMPAERELKIRAELRVRIERAGVRELKLRLPKGTGALVDIKGEMIKEKQGPVESDKGDDWTIKFQKRIRGDYRLTLSFDRQFEEDSWSTQVPEITLPGAQERGFVVVHASPTTALSIERNGLREADVGELPDYPARPPLEVLAYARHPFEVTLSSKRHEPHEVIQAIALSAEILGILSPDGHLRCRAEYNVRNNDQAFLEFALPKGSRLLGALVDGKPTKPLVENNARKLALARSRGRDQVFVVAIIYETRVEALGDKAEVEIARPILDIDVLETRYYLHLPGGYELVGHDGDLVPLNQAQREGLLPSLSQLLVMTGGAAGSPDDSAPELSTGAVTFERQGDAGPYATVTAVPVRPSADKRAPAAVEEPQGRRRLAREMLRSELKSKEKNLDGMVDMEAEILEEPAEEAEYEDHNETDMDEDFEESAGEDGLSDAPFEGKASDSTLALGARAKLGKLLEAANGGEVAKGEKADFPTGGGREAGFRRKRPERALLSLDLQFVQRDNIHRLESLAPGGGVTLELARNDVFDRRHFLGAVLGLATGVLLFLRKRVGLLRLLPAIVLLVIALDFAGYSLLPTDFARGAGQALLIVFAIALVAKLPRFLGRIGRLLRFRRGAKAVASLLLLAAAVQAQESAPREVLVPYGDIKQAGDVDRVFLDSDEYHRLRKLAYPDESFRATAIKQARYEASLVGEEVTLTARYTILKESDETERLPLQLMDVAVTGAKLDDQPANLAVVKRGYVLLLQGKGRHELELTLRPRLWKRGDQVGFAVPIRPVADASLRLTHDRTGYDVRVAGVGSEREGIHYIGPVATVSVAFLPKTEGFKAAAAELRAHTEAFVSVRDGYTAVATRIRYGISGGTADRFRIKIDPSLVIRSVKTADLAGWGAQDKETLVVALTKPASNHHVIEIYAERPTERERTESFPAIAPMGVLRDAGVIALETLPDLKIEILETQGLLRGSAPQTPANLTAAPAGGAVQSVHRFAVRPFSLRWRVFLEQTRLRAYTEVDLLVDRNATHVFANVRAEVERGPGPFSLAFSLPDGYEVQTVEGSLRDWWVDKGQLHVARQGRIRGADSYRIYLRRRGATAESFDAPSVRLIGAVRETGLVRIGVTDGLELDAGGASNLLPEDIAKVGSGRWGRVLRAYRFVEAPWGVSISTREEAREVDALVVSRVVPLQDALRIEALVNFHVRRGLVDRISFIVPVEKEGEALVSAPDLREEVSEPVEGGRRYTLILRTPTRGSAPATVSYTLPYDQPVRGVEPEGASRIRRYVAVEKVPDGEVKVTGTTNLEPGDFDDLPLIPPETSKQSVAGIYVGSGDAFGLEVRVARHSFEDVAKAVIYRATARAVVDRTGWTRVQVTYRVYNRSEQFLRIRLPKDARLYSVLVAGEGVRPLDESGSLLIPMRKVELGAPSFDVDVVYRYEGPHIGARPFELQLPAIDGIDVRRTTLSLFVPRGYSYEFDDHMEQVEESYLAAQRADDIYQEIKELQTVAEQGNSMQQQRALSNMGELRTDFQRAADEFQSTTRSLQHARQLESQRGAIDSLQSSNFERLQSNKQVLTVTPDETPQQRKVQDWGVNRGYLARNQMDDNEDIQEFESQNLRPPARQAQQAGPGQTVDTYSGQTKAPAKKGRAGGAGGAYRGPNSGTPPGMRDPSDPETPPPAPPADSGAPTTPDGAAAEGSLLFGLAALDARDEEARKPQGQPASRPTSSPLFFASRKDEEDSLSPDRAADRKKVLEDAAHFKDQVGDNLEALEMRGAKGRISIRIDLPLEGDVYHFARLGAEGGVEFTASEESGSAWKGLLALICGAAAIFVLRFRSS